MSKEKTTESSWEVEFDKGFERFSESFRKRPKREVKSFIKTLLATERAEMVEKIEAYFYLLQGKKKTPDPITIQDDIIFLINQEK